MRTNPAEPTRPSRRLAVALGINQLLSWATSFYVPAVIADAAARDLRASTAAVLGGFSWALLVAGFCAPRIGRWIGVHGGRTPLAASTVTLAAGLATLAAASHLAGWYAGWTVMGAGMALGLYDAAFATAAGVLGSAVGPAITGITLLGGFASTLGWPAGTALLPVAGWRGVLLAYAAVQIVVNLPLVLAAVPRIATQAQPAARTPAQSSSANARIWMIAAMGGFFAVRWFLSSGIAAHVLPLMGGLGLTAGEAMAAAMLIGPGQVAGRLLEWRLAGRLGPMARARMGAALFPLGALLLLAGGPTAAFAFAVLYGMSNGIMTINRGTLPMLVFGPSGYAALLGWLAVPVLLAQAAAPALVAPLVDALPASTCLLIAGGIAAAASALLVALRPWSVE